MNAITLHDMFHTLGFEATILDDIKVENMHSFSVRAEIDRSLPKKVRYALLSAFNDCFSAVGAIDWRYNTKFGFVVLHFRSQE